MNNDLINEYYVRKFRETARERAQRIGVLKNREDALLYVEEVRKKIRKVFPFEEIPRSPLNAKVLSSYTAGDVVCENILFESGENDFVTANLYRPVNIKGELPAVLHLCGHNLTGKINPNGKALNLALALSNRIVLCVDPLDQEERFRQLFPRLPG